MGHFTYDNLVIENKYNTILNTELNLSNYITVDTSLTEGAGDTKRVVFRSVVGSVDEVEMGEGNTHSIETTGKYIDYKLKTTQAHGFYYDEQAQKDPLVLDTMLKGMAEMMTNDWNEKIIAEYQKATLNEVAGSLNFDGVVDAIAKFKEYNGQLFALVSPKSVATLRKNLKELLSYSESFVRTGYIGTVCGVPVVMSKAIPEGEMIIASKEAVTAFVNKKQEIEVDRDIDKRKNDYWIRTVALIALTDERYVCRLAAAATTTTTVTTFTKNTKTVSGAATTGAVVKVYVNGEFKKEVTADTSAYTITLDDNLISGDVIEVVARKSGEVSSSATVTVA